MNIFIDTEDMEERYGEELYKEYLERENKELKQKVEYYENFEINKTIDKIRIENNKRFKEQQEENERLNKAFDNLEDVIRYYVIGNSKYDDITTEYILNRLLQFRVKDSDK